MHTIKSKIGNKILLGFLVVIVFIIFNGLYTSFVLNTGISTVDRIPHEIDPMLNKVDTLKLIVKDSRSYISNWIYVPKYLEDKTALKNIHEKLYPATKTHLDSLVNRQKRNAANLMVDTLAVDSILSDFDAIMALQARIMNDLNSNDGYDDLLMIMDAQGVLENEIIPQTGALVKRLERFGARLEAQADVVRSGMLGSFKNLQALIWFLGLLAVVLGIGISIYLSRNITRPIHKLQEIINHLRQGKVADKVAIETVDEVGQMADAINDLTDGLNSYSRFALSVGKGELDAEFNKLSEEDLLGSSLLEMRDNLAKNASEEKQRNWAAEGLARFADILRNQDQDVEQLTKEIISNLVKYLDANQGALFIINEDTPADKHLEMAACYAWGRQKFIKKRIDIGEGLVGQSWQENDTLYLTDVPNDFVEITSGLGKANPTSILIVPLEVNDEVYGIIELASFKEVEIFEKEFVQRLAESIASTISNVKINQRTKTLLIESQEQSENLRSQEEEMRQNMEELQATQEEMKRQDEEARKIIRELNKEIDTLKNKTVSN